MVVAGYLRGKEETAHVDDNTLHLKQQQAAIQPYTRVTLLEERELLFRADTLRREIAGFAEEEVKRGASGKKRSRGKRGQRSPKSGRRVVPLES